MHQVSQPPQRLARPLRAVGAAAGPFLREVALVATLLVLYNLGRLVATGRLDSADAHAWALLRLQDMLRLPAEAAIQSHALRLPHVVDLANQYYLLHFPVTAGVLLWLWVRRRDAYYWARWGLALTTGVAMVIHIWVPMTPPRLLAGLGMVDTGYVAGNSAYADSPFGAVANEYAAMPSLHVGWAVLVAVVLVRIGHRPVRWLWLLHPTITLAVVLVTANHYWLDAAIGAGLALSGLALAARIRRGAPCAEPPGPAA